MKKKSFSLAENRLIFLNLEDINKQREAAGATATNTVYNKRTAEANATVQTGGKMGGSDAGAAGNQEAYLAAQQALNVANSTYNNSSAGAGTFYDTQTGEVGISGNGAIQQSAINRLKTQHPEWTDAQIIEQLTSQTAGIQSTLSESGKGMNYDQNGVAIPGTEGSMSLRNNPVSASISAAKAASDAKINQIQITKEISDGKGGFITVLDSSATVKAREAARVAAEQKAAADTNYAASRNNESGANQNPANAGGADTSSQSSPVNQDSFLAGLDGLERQYAGSAMAPLFEFYKGQYADLSAKGLRGEQLIKAIQERTDTYVKEQQSSSKAMESAWTAMYDKIQQSQLESAQRTYDQQQRLATQQKQQDQIEYEKAIRDQNIKNEEDRQSLLLNNGISGGWRSSMHTAKMISAFKKAENIVADLTTAKISNSEAWTNKLIDIEQNYHGNITAAYDAHNVNLLQLQDKLDARAQEIDRTVFNSDITTLQAIDKLTNDWFDGVANIAKDTTNTVIQIQKDTLAAQKEARTELSQEKTDFRSRYQFHISTFGDTDPQGYAQLVEEAKSLGVNIPSVAPTTLEQKSMVMKQIGDGVDPVTKYTPAIVNGVDLASIARTIVGRLPDTRQSAVEKDLFNSIQTGNMNEFMNKAVTNGLEGLSVGTQSDYKDAVKGLGYTADAAKYIPGLEGTNAYKAVAGVSIRTALAQSKDQAWLQALGKFQIVSTKIVQDLSGKQVTDGEARRLVGILSAKGDTVEDVVTKLKLANDYFQTSYDSVATLALGLGYGAAVKNGQIVNFNAPQKKQGGNDDYNDDPSLSQGGFRGSGASGSWDAPKETSMSGVMNSLLGIQTATAKDFSPSAVADTMNQRQDFSAWIKSLGGRESAGYDSDHVKLALSDNHLHGGVDIAVPSGTAIKPLVGGKVVSVSGSAKDKSGWGLSITLEDNNGVFHKYSHLSSVPKYIQDAIEKGENPLVSTDTVFAYSGNSGRSTGAHIDYRARRADGKWIRVEDVYASAPSSRNVASNSSNNNA